MKRIVALAITVALVGIILFSVDRAQLARTLLATNLAWFGVALLFFIPQILAISHRWRLMVSNLTPVSLGECVRLVLASQSMNLVLPAKMGDLSKAYFLKRTGALDLARGAQVVVMEKMLDVAALCVWMLLGLWVALARRTAVGFGPALYPLAAACAGVGFAAIAVVAVAYFIPPERFPLYGRTLAFLARRPRLAKIHRFLSASPQVMALLRRGKAGPATIIAWSLVIWLLHLAQIWVFFISLHAIVPAEAMVAFVPLAIFIGLLPFSIAGIGTRDAAVILLFSAWHPASVMAGVGFFLTLRYIIPASAGLPFLHRYMQQGS